MGNVGKNHFYLAWFKNELKPEHIFKGNHTGTVFEQVQILLTVIIINNFLRENRNILRGGQPPTIHINPRAPEALREQTIGNAALDAELQPAAMVADLGEVAPLPPVPPVSQHYRREEEFEWAPGREVSLRTGGPGGLNTLLHPLLNKGRKDSVIFTFFTCFYFQKCVPCQF